MKIIKAKVYIEQDENSTRYVGYPTLWMQNKEKIPHIIYPRDRSDQATDRVGTYQTIYAVVDDAVYDVLIQDPQCSTPTRNEIVDYQNKHEPKEYVIEDQAIVTSILAKQARGDKLTLEERNALDPEKAERGITKSKQFLEVAKETYNADIQ